VSGRRGLSISAQRPLRFPTISLFVEINSLFTIIGNPSLPAWKCSRISALVPPGTPSLREFPCIFPVDQGNDRGDEFASGLPAPLSSLWVQRLPAWIRGWIRKSPRIRGVLAVEVVGFRTRDALVQGRFESVGAFVSAVHFGGSDWRCRVWRDSADQCGKFESICHAVTAQHETDSSSGSGRPSIVDRSSAGWEKLSNSEADRY